MVPERPDDETIDGCDVDFTQEEQTADEELPQTSGGVVSGEEELDGCDIDFAAEIATWDSELPPTTGGVA